MGVLLQRSRSEEKRAHLAAVRQEALTRIGDLESLKKLKRGQKVTDYEVFKAYGEGLTQNEVAKKLGITQPVVSNRLARLLGERAHISEEEIIETYREGMSNGAAARKLRITGASVSGRRKKLGLKPLFAFDTKKVPDDEIREIFEQGLSIKEAADVLNLSTATVSRYRRILKLTHRRDKGAMKEEEPGKPEEYSGSISGTAKATEAEEQVSALLLGCIKKMGEKQDVSDIPAYIMSSRLEKFIEGLHGQDRSTFVTYAVEIVDKIDRPQPAHEALLTLAKIIDEKYGGSPVKAAKVLLLLHKAKSSDEALSVITHMGNGKTGPLLLSCINNSPLETPLKELLERTRADVRNGAYLRLKEETNT